MLAILISFIFGQSPSFGMPFGNSPKQISESGNQLTLIHCNRIICKYSAIPKQKVSWASSYFLYFANDSLGKIEAYSPEIRDDKFGFVGMNIFQRTDTLLSKKYTKEPSEKKLVTKYNGDNFYKNLKLFGDSDWKMYYTGDDKFISLELLPIKHLIFWRGIIKLTIVKTPGWVEYEDSVIVRDSINQNDIDAM